MLSRVTKKLPRLLRDVVVVLVVVLVLEAFLTRNTVSGLAPSIEAQTLRQQAFSLQTMQGQPSVVHFWATWCSVCELEQSMLDGLAKDYPFISVAMQSGSDAELLAYQRAHEVSYPVINDSNGALSRRYGVEGVPASFVLDSKGKIRFVTRGYTTRLGMQFRLWLASWY